MQWKVGISSAGLHPEMDAALQVLDETRRSALLAAADREAVVTAGKESGHSAHSLHHDGLAIDVRTRDVVEVWAYTLGQRLGPGFDMVIEPGPKCPNCGHEIARPHLHIERDPKKRPLATMTSPSGEAIG